jgi:hypothetical protein
VAAPPSPTLSPSQLATLAELGEERTAKVGDVLYRIGDASYPFIAILEGEARATSARPCTPIPPENLHGKEVVDGSSPLAGFTTVAGRKLRVARFRD